ncbi:hypothetical protein DMB42_48960 [Nonomuraea sp. WAC 01424]|nr:hypothetical protein DMB42_48960 [Nonomuraea sp. WAC 01424]
MTSLFTPAQAPPVRADLLRLIRRCQVVVASPVWFGGGISRADEVVVGSAAVRAISGRTLVGVEERYTRFRRYRRPGRGTRHVCLARAVAGQARRQVENGRT